MCATDQQNQLSDEQTQAYSQALQMTQQQYGNQQEIYAPMAAMFQNILQQGPSQKGFAPAEEQGLTSQAIEGTAENYADAARAVGESTAAKGGGNSPLVGPAGAQEQGQIATSAAQEESSEEQQIQQADYGQGLQNWETAAGELQTIASGENPLGYESAETGSGTAASNTANQIASENDSWINGVLGAAGSVAGGWASGAARK